MEPGRSAAAPLPADLLLDVLAREGAALLDLATTAVLERSVPGCPGWTTRDLLLHLASVYRWVALVVDEDRTERPGDAERRTLDEPHEDDVVGGLRRAHADVLRALRDAPRDLRCWTIWPAESSRDFWVRRQAHETVIHHLDLQAAATSRHPDGSGLDPLLASDGVDEMVCGFAQRYRDRLRDPHERVLRLRAVDTGARWWIKIGPRDPVFGRGHAEGGSPTDVSGRSGELLLLLWNRRTAAGLPRTGDPAALDIWRAKAFL